MCTCGGAVGGIAATVSTLVDAAVAGSPAWFGIDRMAVVGDLVRVCGATLASGGVERGCF